MEFFNQAIDILKILVMALGAGLAVWGVSTFWKVTGRITLRQILVYGKEAFNKDRQSALLFR